MIFAGVNGELRYSLLTAGVPFTVDEFTGAISTSDMLDRESVHSYLLTMQAADATNTPLTNTTLV